jgi:hypothetical protein
MNLERTSNGFSTKMKHLHNGDEGYGWTIKWFPTTCMAEKAHNTTIIFTTIEH